MSDKRPICMPDCKNDPLGTNSVKGVLNCSLIKSWWLWFIWICPLIQYLNAACQLLQYWATIIESFYNTIYSNFRPNRLPNIELLSSSAKGPIQWKAASSSRTTLVGWNPNFDVVSGLIVGCSWSKNARSLLYGRPDADKALQNGDVAGNKLKSQKQPQIANFQICLQLK